MIEWTFWKFESLYNFHWSRTRRCAYNSGWWERGEGLLRTRGGFVVGRVVVGGGGQRNATRFCPVGPALAQAWPSRSERSYRRRIGLYTVWALWSGVAKPHHRGGSRFCRHHGSVAFSCFLMVVDGRYSPISGLRARDVWGRNGF